MQFHLLALLLTTLILLFASATSACKCLVHGVNDREQTEYCCLAHVHGQYDEDKKDCVAHSISEKLTKFSYCCWLRTGVVGSDCKH
ncbi:hypothetical protein PMIN06_009308 [Paraphaeosphaeria minitans]|uniref:Uncharacterized protein n=1 Tax=Paraphaeosphaeria minitans TaxID=565426 RepID=A0A9P6GE55_9PLEO|nr:hypothetical protein PMIN01_08275 [Paraphaeosphaeria minitans]